MAATVMVDTGFRCIEEVFATRDLERLCSLADIIWLKGSDDRSALLDRARREAQVVIAADWQYGPVDSFQPLQAIMEVSGKFPEPEQLDYAACARKGVTVLSCAPAFAPAVAEMALATTLASGRDLLDGDRLMRSGDERWGWSGNGRTFLLFYQRVGFIGFGSIARALKALLAPFRCPICVHDPGMTDSYLQSQEVTPVDLDTLLRTSKIIYVLAAPSAANRALLDRRRLQLIANDALLVLISRAHLVDFDSLTQLVLEGRFRAAVDVFPDEPLARDHPIRRASGALLSAHRAGGDASGFQNIGKMVVDDLEAVLSGLPTRAMQVRLT